MSIVIQKRDLEILKYVFSFRVVSYAQVRKRFFPRQAGATARRRIFRLLAAGLLTPAYHSRGPKVFKCVAMTEKGCAVIRNAFGFEIDRPHWKSESPEHDLRLVDIYEKLSGLRLFSDFKSENMLQSASVFQDEGEFRALVNLQPDGVLILKTEKGSRLLYAIEFEISRKSLDRYQKKLESYYQIAGVDGVIYVYSEQEIANALAKADQVARTNQKSFVHLVSEESVLNSQGKIFLRNVEEYGIGLY